MQNGVVKVHMSYAIRLGKFATSGYIAGYATKERRRYKEAKT